MRPTPRLCVCSRVRALLALAALGTALSAGTPAARAAAALPPLVASVPVDGALDVAQSEWPQLRFAGPVATEDLTSFALACDAEAQDLAVYALEPALVVVDPAHQLPAGASCVLSWPGPDGMAALAFQTAASDESAEVRYDRTDRGLTTPFPDDFWLEDDPTSPTGVRVAVAVPEREPDVEEIFGALLRRTRRLDGFSPLGALVVELGAAPDPARLPASAAETLDPLAPIGLFDVTPGSPDFGARVPFSLVARSDAVGMQPLSHALVLHPSLPLAPGGRYGLVVTRRLLAEDGRPFGPSAFLAAALTPPEAGEAPELARVRELAGEVLGAVASAGALPIAADDVALAVRVSVRTTDGFPSDLLAMKQQVLARPPPAFVIDSIRPGLGDVAAIVEGTWQAPNWRDGVFLAREAGAPVITGALDVPFTLALPGAALDGPVPVTMYQHGSPGSAAHEVPREARQYLAAAGFAVIGFTDTLNVEVDPDPLTRSLAIFTPLTIFGRIPDYWVQTRGEQFAFLRLIEALGALDVLPLDQPDGRPELDVAAPLTYMGFSQGANHGQAFLPYAPEVRAGALVGGGRRMAEVLFHQDLTDPNGTGRSFLLASIPAFYPNLRPPDIWAGLSIFQMLFDVQDAHNHAAFLYADPIEVAGTTRKPSLLVVEGIGDSWTPNNATRSLAWTAGPLPHLEPVQQPVPYLTPVAGPLRANIDADTSAAFVQYVPAGTPGIAPTPGCESEPEGHFCAQFAPASQLQRRIFFESAVRDRAPTIVDALGLGGPPPVPANDACRDATAVPALPAADTLDTTLASVEPADPVPSCAASPPGPSVWYRYQAAEDGTLVVDPSGSGYAVLLALWDAAPGCGALALERACADAARVALPLRAGETVLVQVASADGAPGGALEIAFLPEPSATLLALAALAASGLLAHRQRRARASVTRSATRR